MPQPERMRAPKPTKDGSMQPRHGSALQADTLALLPGMDLGMAVQRAQLGGSALTPTDVSVLQPRLGNRAMVQLLGRNGPAQPRQNANPGGMIQRKPEKKKSRLRSWWDKKFGNKEVVDPIPPEYAPLTAIERQEKAEELVGEATQRAGQAMNLTTTARDDTLGNLYESEDERLEMMAVGGLKKHGGAEHDVARHGARKMGKADRKAIYSQTAPIAQLNFNLQGLVREIRADSPGRIRLGINMATATRNLSRAVQARQMADQMSELAGNLDVGAMEQEAWAHRAGLKDPKSRNLAGAEKSASDAVMGIFDLRNKAIGYAEYMEMDEKALQGHLASKMGELSGEDKLGLAGVKQVVAAGYGRSGASVVAPISDQTARYLRAGLKSSSFAPDLEEGQETDPVAIGRAIGEDTAEAGPDVLSGGPGKKPRSKSRSKDDQLDKETKYLELRAMLHGKSKERSSLARSRQRQVDTLYNDAYMDYSQVDQARKVSNDDTAPDETATRLAGQAHQKVARAGVIVDKMRQAKTEVYDESQRFAKYVGERAMSKSKRRGKQLAGMLGGIGLRVLTGGLYRVEAEQRGGGYRTAIKSKTLLEDISKKVVELKALTKGLINKDRGHGMNRGAMAAYVFFKGLSFAMQVIRDIASGVALWLGITVVGSPVGAVFATIAFYTGAAKLAIDLMLLIWASIARAKTNDPLARVLLSGQQSSQAAEVGAGAGAMGAAGLLMGLSGSTGLLKGQAQQTAFGNNAKLGNAAQFADRPGLNTNIMGVEGVRTLADQVTLGPTILGSVSGVATSDESHQATQAEYSKKGNEKRSAIRAVKAIFHPVNSGVKRLHRFANKTKMKRAAEMAKLGSEVYDQVQILKAGVESQGGDDESETE